MLFIPTCRRRRALLAATGFAALLGGVLAAVS
jgi:hypothetical protein